MTVDGTIAFFVLWIGGLATGAILYFGLRAVKLI
jgi:hypothetical protein